MAKPDATATATATATAPALPAVPGLRAHPGAVAPRNPRAYTGGAPLTVTISAVTPNPKKPGSAAHARYARYPEAPFTLQQALAVEGGPRRDDFLYDLRMGFLLVG